MVDCTLPSPHYHRGRRWSEKAGMGGGSKPPPYGKSLWVLLYIFSRGLQGAGELDIIKA